MEDVKINVKIKISALWATVMFCYLYKDVHMLWRSDIIEEILAGELGGVQVTQLFLLGSAILVVIPIVMVFLSLILKYKANRWANIILGIVYAGFILFTMLTPGTWAYYFLFGTVEVVLTALIAWYAWKWR